MTKLRIRETGKDYERPKEKKDGEDYVFPFIIGNDNAKLWFACAWAMGEWGSWDAASDKCKNAHKLQNNNLVLPGGK